MPNLSGTEFASGEDSSGIKPASGEGESGDDESGIESGSEVGMFCLFFTNLVWLFSWVYGGVVFPKWILQKAVKVTNL